VKNFLTLVLGAASGALVAAGIALHAAALPDCDPDNGGITLPRGFCALVVADGVGPARHLAIAPNGDAYVALLDDGPADPGGVAALRDANGDGRFDTKEKFGDKSVTGIALRNGYLYIATPTSVLRYKMTAGQLVPSGRPETVVHLPEQRQHEDKGIAFDGKGSLYVNVGAPSNACAVPDWQPNAKGQDPCSLLNEHGGIWKFDENTLGQKQTPAGRFATGLRQMPAIAWHDDALYIVMNNRDALDTLYKDRFVPQDNIERPAEPMYRATRGENFGWPYCFWDYKQKQYLLNPEYGGDGKAVGRCTMFSAPVAAFPPHWAPVDVMFYTGTQFPEKYRNGAFIAFHGSWNRSPMPQDGYNVTFQPFANGKPSSAFEVFADGFAGKSPLMQPNEAVTRADGVAQGPDGSLFIADSERGKIWRVIYRGQS